MDKREALMIKKTSLLVLLLVMLVSFSGCTVLGGAGGLAAGVKEGAKKDWEWMKKADDWVKENMW